MNRPALMLGVFGALSLLLSAAGLSTLRSARAEADAAEASLHTLAADARKILDLRSRSENVAAGARPDRDAIALVNGALAAAGLSGSKLRDLAQESDTPIVTAGRAPGAATGLRRTAVRFTLEPVSLPELGRFLGAWREAGGVWTISRVDLTHRRGAPQRPGTPETDGGWTARLLITATYLAEGERTSRP